MGSVTWYSLAQNLQLPSVTFEMYSQAIVQMGFKSNKLLQPLLAEVIRLRHLPGWSTTVIHVYREANRCANLLANLGHLGSFQ